MFQVMSPCFKSDPSRPTLCANVNECKQLFHEHTFVALRMHELCAMKIHEQLHRVSRLCANMYFMKAYKHTQDTCGHTCSARGIGCVVLLRWAPHLLVVVLLFFFFFFVQRQILHIYYSTILSLEQLSLYFIVRISRKY